MPESVLSSFQSLLERRKFLLLLMERAKVLFLSFGYNGIEGCIVLYAIL